MRAPTRSGQTAIKARKAFDVICEVGESPYWSTATSSLWWVDIAAKSIWCGNPHDGSTTQHRLDVSPSFIAAADDKHAVLAADQGWCSLQFENDTLTRLAAPDLNPNSNWRLNDGLVDPTGRVWTGTIGVPERDGRLGGLYSWDGLRIQKHLDDLLTQNGLAISPDSRTLYLADSHPSRAVVWAFDLDLGSGRLSNQRRLHRFKHGRPDGAAVDADGGYWVALVDGHEIVRLCPAGDITHRVCLPVPRPTNICFGGPDMRQCFVTSMRAGLDDQTLARHPDSGALFTFDAPIQGLAQPIPHAFSELGSPRITAVEKGSIH